MPRILIARNATSEIKVALEQERITIGRDKKADLFLDDQEVSRRHAVVINKFGTIYIENVSSTGQIHRGNDVIEFCELAAGEEVRLGSYTLSWKDELTSQMNVNKATIGSPAFGKSTVPVEKFETPKPSNELEGFEMGQALDLDAAPPKSADEAQDSDSEPKSEFDIDRAPEEGADFLLSTPPENGDNVQSPSADSTNNNQNDFPVPSIASPMDAFGGLMGENTGVQTAGYAAGGETKVNDVELSATLKLLKGEEVGREIVLSSNQSEWVVGRGSKCDIPIENPKLSRSHFKIYRDGRFFKISDLGGSSGTRLNGVTVQDAKLSSFDTIKAGLVELQFIIGENRQMASDTGLASDGLPPRLASGNGDLRLEGSPAFQSNSPADKTAFAPPVPYTPDGVGGPPPNSGYSGAANGYSPNQNANDSYQIPNPNFGNSGIPSYASSKPQLPESGFEKIKIWYSDLKPVQKVGYPTLLALLIAGLVMNLTDAESPLPTAESNTVNREVASSDPPPKEAIANNPPNSDIPPGDKDNAAIKGDIGPKYFALSKDKRDLIDEAYAKAERARQERNWNDAYKYSKEVTDAVEIYKKATDILYEAQTNKTNNMIGNVSTNLNNVNDATKENQEKIDLLLEAGEKSLAAQKWEDAEENFRRAMNLDPNNTRATQGYVRASKKDMSAVLVIPNAPAPLDPDVEARVALAEQIQSLNKLVNSAKEKIRSGNFNEGLSLLRQLDIAAKELNSNLKDGRSPASIRDFGVDKSIKLQMSIRESIDLAKSQLEVAYQTSLADAEAFVSNKQYIQAKDIYNKILKMEPEFDKVKLERNKLYSKIVSEAREKYQEALVHENVGDIDQALEGYEQTKELLQDVDDTTASDYYRKSQLKVRRLKR